MFFRRRKKNNGTVFIRYKKRTNNSPLLIVVLMVTGGAFFLIYLSRNPSSQSTIKEPQSLLLNVISKEQKNKTPKKSSKRKPSLQEIKNQANFDNVKPQDEMSKFSIRDGVSLEQEQQFYEILKLMEDSDFGNEDIETQVQQYKLIERKIQDPIKKEQDLDTRNFFIQNFLENARKGGFEVVLDENLKVISITKIKPKLYGE